MKWFTKAISFILTLLFLVSTLSFTVEKHYCGDFLVDVSYVGEPEGCGMEMSFSKKKNCCKDEIYKVEGQDKLQITTFDFSLDKQQFLTAFLISYSDVFVEVTNQQIPFKEFPPPDIYEDYQVLFQSFLI